MDCRVTAWFEDLRIESKLTECRCVVVTTRLSLFCSGKPVTDAAIIARYLAKIGKLDGTNLLETSEVDHWLTYAAKLTKADLTAGADTTYLNKAFVLRTCLVGQSMTHADVAVYAALVRNASWGGIATNLKEMGLQNLNRWYGMCGAVFAEAIATSGLTIKAEIVGGGTAKVKTKDVGKTFDFGDEWKGKAVLRFPPEASGYLHVGHCKAALVQDIVAKHYNAKLIMRFDDTNPAKESEEFEKIILQDLNFLGIKFHQFTHSSDSFDKIQAMATKLVQDGKAYIEDQDKELMSKQKENKLPSPNRDRAVADNMAMWQEMIAGSEKGCTYVMRLRMDPAADNGQLRDPAIYRTSLVPHVRTGDKYKVYPLYCFSCPLVDSFEGVTHALRTTEYIDQDVQYAAICKLCDLRCPKIESFARLDFKFTCLAKRQLRWFIANKKVTGWDDPRFPTLRGVLKRGLTMQGLRGYIQSQGASRNNTVQTQDKMWSMNKAVIDPIAPRHFALLSDNLVKFEIEGVKEAENTVAGHPKNPKVASKQMWTAPSVFIEAQDAAFNVTVGQKVTLMDLGNVMVTDIEQSCGVVLSVKGTYLPDDKDYKSSTARITWLADCKQEKSGAIPVEIREHGNIIDVEGVNREEGEAGLSKHASKVTEWTYNLTGASSMKSVKQGDIIQIQRRGFYICEEPHIEFTSRKCVLNAIPDGHAHPKQIKDDAALPVSQELCAEADELLRVAKETKEFIATSTKGDKTEEKKALAKQKTAESVAKTLAARAKLAVSDGSSAPPVATKAKAGTAAAVNELKVANAPAEAVGAAIDAYEKGQGKAPAPQTPAASAGGGGDEDALTQKIAAAGDLVRELKKDKKDISGALAALKVAKAEYKEATGKEFKPPKNAGRGGGKKTEEKKAAPAAVNPKTTTPEALAIKDKITEAGNKVRDLKKDKQDIKEALATLKALKEEYEALTGQAYGGGVARPAKKAKQPKKGGATSKAEKHKPKADVKGKTKLGLQFNKEEELSSWYPEVIVKSDLIEYYTPVSGCYILKPPSYAIWEVMKAFFDAEIKELGVENAYFPMFVSESQLNKEKDHIADFSPEVAWVTRSGDTELKEPIAIRPTSETVIYPFYAKWIRSHRDLPMRMNQWCNVVRWEFKQPQPFLRTREFLWQEGHTCFADKAEAVEEVMQILDLYGKCYEDVLALPVVRGRKTEKEKFAGGDFTTTVEAFIPAAGRCIQGATSHHLGQNFSKMFNIEFEAADGTKNNKVYQNSWGITTRTIGVMVMVHSDNKGLVTPPRVAKIQVVIIPCGVWKDAQGPDPRYKKCEELQAALKKAGVRAHADLRVDKKPGWKYSDWELKGIPIRLEVGPADIEKKQVVAVRRDTGDKTDFQEGSLGADLTALMTKMQAEMYAKADAEYAAHRIECTDWKEFVPLLNKKNVLLVPFCGDKDCEDKIKELSASVSVYLRCLWCACDLPMYSRWA